MLQRLRRAGDDYGFFHLCWIALCVLCTRVFLRPASLVRLPIFIRGRRRISWGRGFVTGYFVRIDAFGHKSRIRIGQDVQVNDAVHIGAIESVDIGDRVLIASRVFITDHNHGDYGRTENSSPDVAPALRPLYARPVRIEDDVWIGEAAVILPGVTVGRGCVIAANAVVTVDVPPMSVVAGVPARVVRSYDPSSRQWRSPA
jgi:lipopolysaccharide O-acetyltransferase